MPRTIDRLPCDDATNGWSALLPARQPRAPLQGDREVDWVIVGGESGPGARPMDSAWAIDLRDQCLNAGVAFFFKQWGGVQKKKAGRLLEKRTWDQMPRDTALA